jgi:hypothetical protein
MTRKDYQLIAKVFADLQSDYNTSENGDDISLESVIRELSVALWRDNSRFDEKIFLKACGL